MHLQFLQYEKRNTNVAVVAILGAGAGVGGAAI